MVGNLVDRKKFLLGVCGSINNESTSLHLKGFGSFYLPLLINSSHVEDKLCHCDCFIKMPLSFCASVATKLMMQAQKAILLLHFM